MMFPFINPYGIAPRRRPQRKKASKQRKNPSNRVVSDGSSTKSYSVFSPVLTNTPKQIKIGPDATVFDGTNLCTDALCYQFYQVVSLMVRFIPTLNQFNAVGSVNLWISNDENAPAPTDDAQILNSCSSAKGKIFFTGAAKSWSPVLPKTEKVMYSTGRGEVTAGGTAIAFPYVLNAAIIGGGTDITNFGRLELVMTIKWHGPGAAPTNTTRLVNTDERHLSTDPDIYIEKTDEMWAVDQYYVQSDDFKPKLTSILTNNKYVDNYNTNYFSGTGTPENKAIARADLITAITTKASHVANCPAGTAPKMPAGYTEGYNYVFDETLVSWINSEEGFFVPIQGERAVYNVAPTVLKNHVDFGHRSIITDDQPVYVTNTPLDVNVTNDPLKVEVVNDPLDVNVTNNPLNCRVVNEPLDVVISDQPILVEEKGSFGDSVLGILGAVIPFIRSGATDEEIVDIIKDFNIN